MAPHHTTPHHTAATHQSGSQKACWCVAPGRAMARAKDLMPGSFISSVSRRSGSEGGVLRVGVLLEVVVMGWSAAAAGGVEGVGEAVETAASAGDAAGTCCGVAGPGVAGAGVPGTAAWSCCCRCGCECACGLPESCSPSSSGSCCRPCSDGSCRSCARSWPGSCPCCCLGCRCSGSDSAPAPSKSVCTGSDVLASAPAAAAAVAAAACVLAAACDVGVGGNTEPSAAAGWEARGGVAGGMAVAAGPPAAAAEERLP